MKKEKEKEIVRRPRSPGRTTKEGKQKREKTKTKKKGI